MESKCVRHPVILIILSALQICSGQDAFTVDLTKVPSYFVKFGPAHGDLMIQPNDDGSSGSIHISTAFPYFDHLHNFLFVSTNGVISFLRAVSTYTPESFPLGSDRRLIAAFWGDVHTSRNGGRVYYRLVHSRSLYGLTRPPLWVCDQISYPQWLSYKHQSLVRNQVFAH